MKIFFDGGCRPNPGPIEIAAVTAGRAYVVRDAGSGTSMDAEWLALIHALRLARSLELSDIVLLGDALAVVEQANGRARSIGTAREYRDRFLALAAAGAAPRVRHIRRAQNLAGIALGRLHPR